MLSVNLKRVAAAIYRGSGTTKVRNLSLKYLREERWKDLVSLHVDPRDYIDPLVFRKDYQSANFLRKIQGDIPGVDRKAKAIENFWTSERQCYDTNKRFERLIEQGSLSVADCRSLEILERGKRWLERVLGDIPEDLVGRFGPGASAECRGPASTIPDKLSSRASITPAARDLLPLLYRTQLLGRAGRQYDPETTRGNVFTTVLKDALKDRGICIEPGLNVWLQLGVGLELRSILRKLGIDLDHSQEIHRQWAQQASHDGLKATIDLSNASDCLARIFLRWFLPQRWYDLLDSLRSPVTYLDGKRVVLEKFSSMGNGYTFELETLVFLAICHSVNCGSPGVNYRVFGDDIIVDTERAVDVIAALRYCGFTPNPRKTFVDGWFRESCGGDFFKGVEVTSHKQRVDPAAPHEWFSLLNGLRRVSFGREGVGFEYSSLYPAWLAALGNVTVEHRQLKGPKDLGDLVIHDCDYQIDYSKGYGRVRVLKPQMTKLKLHHWKDDIVLAYLCYNSRPVNDLVDRSARSAFGPVLRERGLSTRESTPRWPFVEAPRRSEGVIARGDPKGYRIGYVAFG